MPRSWALALPSATNDASGAPTAAEGAVLGELARQRMRSNDAVHRGTQELITRYYLDTLDVAGATPLGAARSQLRS